jgi:isopentenyl-diphosphate delta-isomerase
MRVWKGFSGLRLFTVTSRFSFLHESTGVGRNAKVVTSRPKGTSKPKSTATEDRKLEHLRICLERDVQSLTPTGLEDVRLVHAAAPEINLDDVDTSCTFLGHRLRGPLMVTAITGGHAEATPINRNIAEAIEKLGLAMGVGSQRAAIEDAALTESFEVVRKSAPTAFLVGNIGAAQLASGYGVTEAKTAITMIKANALAIHFNAAQEAVQPEGEASFAGVLQAFKTIASKTSVPLIAKETGAGFSRETAAKLADAGAKALDVAGLGGTSWPAVEAERAQTEDARKVALGRWFTDWGIPTAASTFEVARTVKIPIIASGGIRTGIDLAKAIALGAKLGGVALPVLAAATQSAGAVRDHLDTLVHGLRAAMFLVGAKSLEELARAPLVVSGATRTWLELRGYDLRELATRQIR